MSPLSLTAAADCSAMPDPYLRDLMLDWSIRRTCYPSVTDLYKPFNLSLGCFLSGRELADRGTRAGWTSDASCSDANGKLRTSRIRNALGLELIGWMQDGTRAGAD
ncbi:hypothetical protein F2Q70_00025991 [Brassica cretica]|uniref:Uncharacterized protein n=1 Tax=Brassica cretica TaxID=69181 RepID=A0A8S9L6K5_BRACR|nr:hypothetical protein F2Q70_00025991 [Brassica cretica]